MRLVRPPYDEEMKVREHVGSDTEVRTGGSSDSREQQAVIRRLA